jgi:hypothetical protein
MSPDDVDAQAAAAFWQSLAQWKLRSYGCFIDRAWKYGDTGHTSLCMFMLKEDDGVPDWDVEAMQEGR